jgi:hypothetical protein
MKRATITMSDEIEAAVEAYRRDQEAPLPLTSLAETALREFLIERGYLPSGRILYLTPAEKGTGKHDVSTNHDRYFADE